jgi:Rps23 Pro-64 3,4-dihydroxylase Tpa1-like proline 4-hydroxylase
MKDNKRRSGSKNEDVIGFARIISDRINTDANLLSSQWQNPQGTNTRHFIVDNLLPRDMASRIYEAFPQDKVIWFQYKNFRERKKVFAKLASIDALIGSITDAFHEADVLKAVRLVTGIEGLEADPELYAGGISMMGKGDFLNPHIDNSHDAPRVRYRRLNLLYYISPGWQADYGGNFELWDENTEKPTVIVSKYNRLVVMETNRTSWHSVNPVCVDKNRCCVSNYYFSQNSPEIHEYYHVTSFVGRPNQKIRRLWGRVDNALRQWIAVNLRISRGKSLSRFGR